MNSFGMDFLFGNKRRNKTSVSDNKTKTSIDPNDNDHNKSKMDSTIADLENNAKLDDRHPRHLAQKSGFVSLQERMKRLTFCENEHKRRPDGSSPNVDSPVDKVKHTAPQFASLHEFFSSQNRRSLNFPPGHQEQINSTCDYKKPKIPVMKLSKSDWNVKCWEDRLILHKRRYLDNDGRPEQHLQSQTTKQRLKKPAQQNEVFKSRIEDVNIKLGKVREGVPLDEELFQLAFGRRTTRGADGGVRRGSHQWTDMLKNELEEGTHNSKQLRTQLEASIGPDAGRGLHKSPLGRPVRRMFEDDTDEEE